MGRHEGAQPRKELRVSECPADGVQRECAALVDAIVEHVGRPRIADHDVAGQFGEALAMPHRALVGTAPAGLLRPQPLRVAGDSFVQPDVAPTTHGEAVAEPLVCELVRDEPLTAVRAVDVVASEGGEALRLERNLEHIAGHDNRIPAERIGPEHPLE